MALGVLSLFGGGGLGGLWWILIGWFISSLATMSYRQLIMDRALLGFKVADLMRTRFDEVRTDMRLSDFIDNRLLRSTQQLWPAVEEGEFVGILSLSDVVELSADERDGKFVGDVMRPLDSIRYISPDVNARDAFHHLANAEDEPVPVVWEGKIVGMIQRGDIVKWMSLHDM